MAAEREAPRVDGAHTEEDQEFEGMSAILWRKMRRNKSAMAGLMIIALLLFLAVFADWIAPFSYENPAGEGLQTPSWRHPFGTDGIGRDMFSRVIHGTRVANIHQRHHTFPAFAQHLHRFIHNASLVC